MTQKKRKITAEDLFKLRVPQSVNISPDGRNICYSARKIREKKNRYCSHIFTLNTEGGKPRALTRGNSLDTHPVWSPDGKRIAFVSDRRKSVPDVWVIAADGGKPIRLTDLKGGDITGLSWAPDGKALLFLHLSTPRQDKKKAKFKPAYKHVTRLYHKQDGIGWYRDERQRLCTVSCPGGRVRKLTDGENDVSCAVWSPDGTRIAFLLNDLPEPDRDLEHFHSDIFVIDIYGKQRRRVTRKRGYRTALDWSEDGKTIFFLGNHMRPGEWIRHTVPLRSIPSAGGAEKVLTPGVVNWTMNMVVTDTLSGSSSPIRRFSDGGSERIAFMHEGAGSCELWSVPAGGGDMRLELGGKINVTNFSVSSYTGKAAAVVGEMMTAGDIFSLTMDGTGKAEPLTRMNASLFDSLDLREPEEIWFKNRDVKIQGWIIKPPGFRMRRKYPCLLEVHGGPMCQYGYTFFHEMHLLAAQGYVVAFSNPRGSSGRGLKYMNCIEGNWGKLDYSDIMALADFLTRQKYVDPRRLGILGGSYGGFMSTWAVGHTNRFKAAVTQRALGNWMIQFGSSDFGWEDRFEMGATPWEKPLHYMRLSPNYYVENIRTPLLIIHSEQDLRCPIGQAMELFTSLKLLGRTTEMVLFEDESHGLSRGGKPMNRIERLDRIVDWFRRYL